MLGQNWETKEKLHLKFQLLFLVRLLPSLTDKHTHTLSRPKIHHGEIAYYIARKKGTYCLERYSSRRNGFTHPQVVLNLYNAIFQ